MRLAPQVEKTIRKYRMLSRGDGVLAAVSGGPDSVALLHVLWKLSGALGFRLEVAHVEHGIRGEESKADARFVAEIAGRLALRYHLREVDLPRIKSERGKGNLEALARAERYGFFSQLAVERGIEKIATGHTRDDQVETLLMRLMRGSGRKGLGAMAPVRRLTPTDEGDGKTHPSVIRPLIETSRKEIEEYLAAEALPHRTDLTNLDPALLRNWVRLDLLPQLRRRVGAGLDRRLARMAEMLRDEEEVLDAMTRGVFPKVKDKEGNLSRAALVAQPKAIERRLVRLWLGQILGNLGGVDLDHVEAILDLISEGPPQGRAAIPRGREVVRNYGSLGVHQKARPSRAGFFSYLLPIGGELVIPEAGVKIGSARMSLARPRPESDLEALFDLNGLPETLTVRNFRPGDRFRPIGMEGRKKIKDLFIEKKIPMRARATLPLLLAGDEILWIPGCGRSRVAKVEPMTTDVLKVDLTVLSDG